MFKQRLVFLYDKFKDENPVINGHQTERSWMIYRLEQMNISVDILDLKKYTSEAGSLAIYPIELLRADFATLFDSISVDTWNFLRINKIPILLYFPTEGFNSVRLDWLDHIHRQMIKHEITQNNIYVIFGSLTFGKEYNAFLADSDTLLKTYRFKKVFSLSYFEWLTEHHLNTRWQNPELYSREYITKEDFLITDKKYNFLSYNGNFRTHRIAMVSEILRHNIHNESLLSFSGGADTDLMTEANKVFELLSFDARCYFSNYIKNWEPIILDFDKESRMKEVNNVQKMHYLESCFSLIAETEYETGSIFLTEKTFKAIKSLHPFVIYGNPGSLEILRNMGYETFPELFCEAYDEETNHKRRLQMIMHEVIQFNSKALNEKNQLIKSITDKLLYNRDVLERRAREIPKSLRSIFKTIIKTESNDKRN